MIPLLIPNASRTSHCVAASNNVSPSQQTLVKICGVTNIADAKHVAQQGADFMGMIIWPKAKRSVKWDVAKEMASIAKAAGVLPVGVFVDESPEQIAQAALEIGLGAVQLHGDAARTSLALLPTFLRVIYVLHARPDGSVVTRLPYESTSFTSNEYRTVADYLLYDSLQGGSGESFDWTSLQSIANQQCRQSKSRGWMLAGGLTPLNVSEAVRIARPNVVDVSSGVCGPDGLLKDWDKVSAFIQNAKRV